MPTVYSTTTSTTPPSVKTVKRVHMRPLAAYAEHPLDVRFETQEEKETVELFLRQHPIVNVTWIILVGIMIFSPTILFPIILSQFPNVFPARYVLVFTLFWYIATFGFTLTNLLRWFFNIYIVTNERVVDIDFKYLLYKHFSEAELSKIQDISFTTSGIMATIFNYGNVLVETAGEQPDIEFEMIPHPQKVVETIRSLADKVKSEHI
jgi:uncharacterized membrane protein YdbT with pleckstrin-like domain